MTEELLELIVQAGTEAAEAAELATTPGPGVGLVVKGSALSIHRHWVPGFESRLCLSSDWGAGSNLPCIRATRRAGERGTARNSSKDFGLGWVD